MEDGRRWCGADAQSLELVWIEPEPDHPIQFDIDGIGTCFKRGALRSFDAEGNGSTLSA